MYNGSQGIFGEPTYDVRRIECGVEDQSTLGHVGSDELTFSENLVR